MLFRSGDWSSYHYAVKAAAEGGDPYDVRALGDLARAERTRRTVQPYFYPPTFLLTVAWSLPLPLMTASNVAFVLNEGMLAAVFFLLWRMGAPAWGLALLAVFPPITENLRLGQANVATLLPIVLALWSIERRGRAGGWLAGAALLKMSPALLLAPFALQRRWRAFFGAMVVAGIGITLSFVLVRPAPQLRFWTEVLPGFFGGGWHGLQIPVVGPTNLSLAAEFARLYPTRAIGLSETAAALSRGAGVALLVAWALAARRVSVRDALLGLTPLMVFLPTYTWEAHLVLLLPALALLAGARPIVFVVLVALLGIPEAWRMPLLGQPGLATFAQLAKVGAGLVLAGVWVGRRRPQ